MKVSLARFKLDLCGEITWVNHWRHCNRNSGHAILLGFQYGTWANYQQARQVYLEITVLGIGFEIKGPRVEEWKAK